MNSSKFLAILLLGFASSAGAVFEGDQPTTEEAHAFLGGTFQRYTALAYMGDGCASQLSAGRGKRAMKVNWSAVSAVEQHGDNSVDLQGAGPRGNLRVQFPNERAARSAANAFELLRSSCVPPALTARR